MHAEWQSATRRRWYASVARDATTYGKCGSRGRIVIGNRGSAMPFRPSLPCDQLLCLPSRRRPSRAKPGLRRAVLPRQDHQHLCRLVRRRRLRHLRPAAGAASSASRFPGSRPSSCRTCRAPAATRRPSYIYSVAPKDGTAIGAIFPGAMLQPLLGDTAVQHEPNKFIYLGSANSDVYHCFCAHRRAGQELPRRARQAR